MNLKHSDFEIKSKIYSLTCFVFIYILNGLIPELGHCKMTLFFEIDLADYLFYPMPSFSCKTLTHVSCAVRLNTTLLLGLRSTRNNFVLDNIGI